MNQNTFHRLRETEEGKGVEYRGAHRNARVESLVSENVHDREDCNRAEAYGEPWGTGMRKSQGKVLGEDKQRGTHTQKKKRTVNQLE